MTLLRALTLVTAFVVAAAGCQSVTEVDRAVSGPAPFDAVLIELFGTTDTDAYLAERERAAAEIVGACMQAAGFEFALPPQLPPEAVINPNDLDYARRDGFGVVAGFRRQVANTHLTNQTVDSLNRSYLTSLPSDEIDRFFLTLDGVPAAAGQQQTNTGCNGAASDEAYADWLQFFDAVPNYTAMGEERDSHPDWLAARADWRACMMDRGFDYAEPDAIRSDVVSRMRATVDEVFPGRQVPIVETADGFEVGPEVEELLAELAVFEREAAVANVECTAPLADRFTAVEFEVQQGFVDRNRSAIDLLLATASAG